MSTVKGPLESPILTVPHVGISGTYEGVGVSLGKSLQKHHYHVTSICTLKSKP